MRRNLSRRPSILIVAAVAAVCALLVGSYAAYAQARVSTVVAFTPPQLPEGLTVDAQGNLYVSTSTGEIRRITPTGASTTLATLRNGQGFLLGLTTDAAGNVYVALGSNNAPDTDTHGIWRIRPDGTKALFAALPPTSLPNGLVFDRQGNLLVSDSAGGAVWRITSAGQATSWVDHALLRGDADVCPPNPLPLVVGANGIAFDRNGDLFVANTHRATVVRVPVNASGAAGTPVNFVGPDCARLKGADGLTFDLAGNLYVTANMLDIVVRITPARAIQTIATRADGLDFPASAAFGRTRADQSDLYVTNFAILNALSGGPARPSVVRIAGAAAGPTGLPATGGGGIGTAAVPLTSAAAAAAAGVAALALVFHRRRR